MESIGDIDSSSFYGVLGMKNRLEKAQEETGREDIEIVGETSVSQSVFSLSSP